MSTEVLANSNAAAAEERRKATPSPDPPSISEECLSLAEEAAEQVLNCVHPTLDSEEKRTIVVDYVQQLVKSRLSCEVVSYGSVPLKTYLPDGDIDLTVVKGGRSEDSLAREVLALLQDQEWNQNAEYEVKDTQFIDAEVKLVKCLVRGTVIDISFNQLGGLSTLCFLEQVDRLVGRNHLFKRSIILIKTWCYYESRILGAHHGLISTYALETLILYIFQVFHSSMNGPLAVLYRFLDYYSCFDWANYCISLKGPVCKSSLPDVVVKLPGNVSKDLLLSENFLEKCLEMYSVSSRGPESHLKTFQIKHLNIIDPLKDYNNLGRSVNKGNFYRIQSAFKYGARKLSQILLQPKDKVGDEICKFFANTHARHGIYHRSCLRRVALESDYEESLTASLSSPDELSSEYDLPLKSSDSDFDNNSLGVDRALNLEFQNSFERNSAREVSPEVASEACCSTDGLFISGHGTNGDKDSFEMSNSTLRNDQSGYTSSDKYSTYLSENLCHKPHHYSLKSWLEDRDKHVEMNNTARCCINNPEAVYIMDSSSTTRANILDNSSLYGTEIDSTNLGGELETLDPLADLTGDYDSHIRSLLRGRLCHGFASSAPVTSDPPSSPSWTQNKKTKQEIIFELKSLWQNKPSHTHLHKISTEHIEHSGVTSTLLGTAFQFEGKQKARGTGTYFPQMNVYCVEKPSHGRGRYNGSSNHNHLHKYGNKNGIYPAYEKPESFEYCHNEVLPAQSKHQGQRKFSACNQPTCLVGDRKQINGYSSVSCKIEFGSVGNLAEEVLSRSTCDKASTPLDSPSRTQGPRAGLTQGRAAGQTIHLKNEDEFPPLCQ